MFTGLIERTGIVQDLVEFGPSSYILKIDPGRDFHRTLGASIAVNGVCLTETNPACETHEMIFHVSPETVKMTSIGQLRKGHMVNLERAMCASDRFGGHMVLGHVDGTGQVLKIEKQGDFWALDIAIPKVLSKYVICKGSMAIDGTSLTVNKIVDIDDASSAPLAPTIVSFMLIPLTWNKTRMSTVKPNDLVNIEVDLIAKHLERLTQPWHPPTSK